MVDWLVTMLEGGMLEDWYGDEQAGTDASKFPRVGRMVGEATICPSEEQEEENTH